jgi:hypothetical protein
MQTKYKTMKSKTTNIQLTPEYENRSEIFMRRNVNVILMAIIILVSANLAHAESKSIAQKTNETTAKKDSGEKIPSQPDKYSKAQIDLSLEKLTPNYYGNNPKSILSALKNRKNTAKKDEFETSEQFEKRVENEKRLPIIGQIGLEGIFSLQTKAGKGDIKYSADDSEFTIEITLDKIKEPLMSGSYNKNAKTIMLIDELISSNTHSASNSYGAIIEVKEKNYEEYQAAIANFKSFPFKEGISKFARDMYEFKPNPRYLTDDRYKVMRISSKLKANTNEAKSLKENIKVLLIGKIDEPQISDSYFHAKPTRDDPAELTVMTNYIYLNLQEIWIYNQATGQIYSKIKRQEER